MANYNALLGSIVTLPVPWNLPPSYDDGNGNEKKAPGYQN
jgi:hypothetical protein